MTQTGKESLSRWDDGHRTTTCMLNLERTGNQSMFGGHNAIGKTIIDVKLVKVALYTKGTTFYEPTSQYGD